jgi:multimeric flavodoxin WrbA
MLYTSRFHRVFRGETRNGSPFQDSELSMPASKANILVAFYSREGSVEALAKAVSEGARQAGAEVRLRRVPDIVSAEVMAKVPGWEERSKRMLAEYGAPTPADAEWADGIIFGTPTRFGNTSAELKASAEEGTRTPTALRPPAPKAGASANSATSA